MVGDYWEEQEAGTPMIKMLTWPTKALVQTRKALQRTGLRARLRRGPLSPLVSLR